MITFDSKDVQIVFKEFPDETTLAINLYGCPHKCKGCHSPQLWNAGPEELTEEKLDKLIEQNSGITCVGFMGGDNDIARVFELAEYIASKGLKAGWYTGYDYVSPYFRAFSWRMCDVFDYVKYGPYIEELGGLDSPTTNQVMLKRDPSRFMKNITKSFLKTVL